MGAGTVTNVREASLWLSYTYLFVRMLRNPLAYGVGWEELTADPRLDGRRQVLVSCLYYCTASKEYVQHQTHAHWGIFTSA